MALTLLQMKARFQDPMRQGVVDMLRQSSRIMDRLHFISQPGLSYPYSQRTKLPGVGFRGLNENYTASIGVINPSIERLAIMGGSVRTDHVAIDTKGDAARTNEIAGKIESAAKFFDKAFFKGDMTKDVKGFDGLERRLTGKKVITQATNGATPTYQKAKQLQNLVEGPNNTKVLLMNQTTHTNLIDNALSNTNARMFVSVDPNTGNDRFNGSEIIDVFNDENEDEILAFDETCGSSDKTSSIYCVRFGGAVDERYVQGLSGLAGDFKHRGPIVYGTYVEDVVESVMGIGLFSGHCAARLKGVLES